MVRTTGDRSKQHRGPLGRIADWFIHPIGRRRRTAAHRRVLHRQQYTGLVTEVPGGRFEMDEHTRKVLGLDPGPPGRAARHDRGAEGSDGHPQAESRAEGPVTGAAGAAVEDAEPAPDATAGPLGHDPPTQAMSAVEAFDPLADAISLALTDHSKGDDVRRS